MKNIIIVGAFPEKVTFIKGGVQASVYGLAKALAARTDIASVQVISLPVKGSLSRFSVHKIDGIKVVYLKPHRFLTLDVLHLPKVMRTVFSARMPLVHIHGTGLLQALLIAALHTKRITCIWTLHGITAKETLQRYHSEKTFPALTRHLLYRLIEKFSVITAPHIIVDTPYVQKELGRQSGISVIPQGIFSDEFLPVHGMPRPNPVILSIGVIAPRKGHHLTLEAFARVHTQSPQSRLIIAGSISDTDYYRQLQEQIRRLRLSESVKLLTNIPRAEILRLFADAQIFALHSQEESQGIALCEALAAGLPVVATGIGGIPFVITHGKDGLLVDYGDVAGFASAVLSLLENPALYEQMATIAKISARRFDWKNIAEEVMNTYAKCDS